MEARRRCRSTDIGTVMSAVLRAVAIASPVALIDTPVATAQALESRGLIADIPARPIVQALATLARQTGLQIVYFSDVVHAQKSQLAPAGLSANEALARVFEGTGLQFEYLTPRSDLKFAAATDGSRSLRCIRP